MSHTTEVVVTSDASGQLWSGCIWDPHTGNALMTYKSGGVAAPHCLSLLGSDYLLTADTTKPLLRVWALNSHEPVQQGIRLVVPGRVSALATSPDGLYLVAAVDCKLYIWQINSGDLLSVAARHFLRITVIKFTDDGCLFASAGEDSMVMVWSLQSLISQHDANMSLQQEPLYSYSDHALAVHDIYIGPGGMRSRMYTVSADRTCKVYDLSSGTLLLSMAFDSRLSSVTVDPTETEVFVGTIQGDIYQFTLRQPPRDIENFMLETSPAKSFVGHKKTVACLSVSQDGLILLSGSEDGIVMLWHIPSRQSTKTLVHKEEATDYVESEGDRLIKRLVQKQLDTRLDLKEQLKQSKQFERVAEFVPLGKYTSGQTTLQQFEDCTKKASHNADLKSCGLSEYDIALLQDHENENIGSMEKYRKIEVSELKKRLQDIYTKIEAREKDLAHNPIQSGKHSSETLSFSILWSPINLDHVHGRLYRISEGLQLSHLRASILNILSFRSHAALSPCPVQPNVIGFVTSGGVSRHQQELGLSVKPSSEETKLLQFALSCRPARQDLRPANHPIHHLKEMEQELFGHLELNKKKGKRRNKCSPLPSVPQISKQKYSNKPSRLP
uniref:WD repeat-containing protein 18 n=1 Tax=Timema genevievae TaxID=629358 RepID=A0A7R9JQK6_TIMGE|nr:unnamed protein product [Timema genevievae]